MLYWDNGSESLSVPTTDNSCRAERPRGKMWSTQCFQTSRSKSDATAPLILVDGKYHNQLANDEAKPLTKRPQNYLMFKYEANAYSSEPYSTTCWPLCGHVVPLA